MPDIEKARPSLLYFSSCWIDATSQEGQHEVAALRALSASCGLDFALAEVDHAETVLATSTFFRIVVCSLGDGEEVGRATGLRALEVSRQRRPGAFRVAFGSRTAWDPRLRLDAFQSGAAMVTADLAALARAAGVICRQGFGAGSLPCPGDCGLRGFTEEELHRHYPLYHAAEGNVSGLCPICGEHQEASDGGLDVHLHNHHGPSEDREPSPAPYAAFAWVVCQGADGRFLLVHEPAGLCDGMPLYWLPAGRVDAGEALVEAAKRETLEEGGVEVEIVGILRFMLGRQRAASGKPPVIRVVFLARPLKAECGAKTIPDFESCGAVWSSLQDLLTLKEGDFRSPDPLLLYPLVANGQLQPLPVDTEAFRAFDARIQELTTTDPRRKKPAVDAIADVWAGLRATYPAWAFTEG